MLIAVVLALQSESLRLPDDSFRAAQRCRDAATALFPDKGVGSSEQTAQVSYFALAMIGAEPAAKRSISEVNAYVHPDAPIDAAVAAAAGQWMAICDAAYPKARSRTATLPAPGYDRDLLCMTSAKLAWGMTYPTDVDGPDGEIRRVSERTMGFFLDRMNRLYANRMPQDRSALATLVLNAMTGSTRFGNAAAITRTCAVDVD